MYTLVNAHFVSLFVQSHSQMSHLRETENKVVIIESAPFNECINNCIIHVHVDLFGYVHVTILHTHTHTHTHTVHLVHCTAHY